MVTTSHWRESGWKSNCSNLTQWLALIVSIWCTWMQQVLALSLSFSLILYCNSCMSGWKREPDEEEGWRNWISPGREWARSQMATCSELGDGVVSFLWLGHQGDGRRKKLLLLPMSIGHPKWPNLCIWSSIFHVISFQSGKLCISVTRLALPGLRKVIRMSFFLALSMAMLRIACDWISGKVIKGKCVSSSLG